ncbi:MAG: DNA-binding GntR family transcriptional regulator [Parasphingorhabdus sp.]|jgi:DNA-binding GntR family transcriptional regulator
MVQNQSKNLKATSLVEKIFDDLRDDILRGNREAGSRLSIKSLSDLYGVSSIPVREALARLLSTRLVRISPNQGYFVSDPMEPDDFRQLFKMRLILESAAIRDGIKNITADNIKLMRSLNEKMKRQTSPEKPNRGGALGLRINTEFHCVLIDLPQNRFLSQTYRDLCFEVVTSRQIPATLVQWEAITTEHDELIDALDAQDAELAISVVTRHMAAGQVMVLDSFTAV